MSFEDVDDWKMQRNQRRKLARAAKAEEKTSGVKNPREAAGRRAAADAEHQPRRSMPQWKLRQRDWGGAALPSPKDFMEWTHTEKKAVVVLNNYDQTTWNSIVDGAALYDIDTTIVIPRGRDSKDVEESIRLMAPHSMVTRDVAGTQGPVVSVRKCLTVKLTKGAPDCNTIEAAKVATPSVARSWVLKWKTYHRYTDKEKWPMVKKNVSSAIQSWTAATDPQLDRCALQSVFSTFIDDEGCDGENYGASYAFRRRDSFTC